jgi:hypothetical protein
MPGRRFLAVLLTAATLVITTATRAGAAVDHPVGIWSMNEPSGARVLLDSSGHGLAGTVGAEVSTGVVVDGATAYRFSRLQPDTPPPHPRHLVTVPDNAALDPGNRDYAVTVRIRTTYRFGNIIQKGQWTVPGGSFKFQIPNGIVQCYFRGSAGAHMVASDRPLNDGAWHTVRCERTLTQVTMTVDGTLVARRAGRTGTIANTWPLAIGGKTACDQIRVTCDYFAGDIDRVEIDVR